MKTFLTVILALVCAFTFAQKKPNINKAKSAMEKGELTEAKSIIDQAIVFEKTKDDAKTWYYRGMIYATLDTAMNEPGALETSIAAFNRSLELDPVQKSTSTFTGTGIVNVDTHLQNYYAFYLNRGIEKYTNESFEEAVNLFEKAFLVNPKDTSAILNTAYAATAIPDVEKARNSFSKALEIGAKDRMVFLQLYNYALKEENFDKALDLIRKGKSEHPDDTDFSKYEINLLIQLNKVDEAKEEISKAIELEPNNPDLKFSLGVLKEETGDTEGAIKEYQDALNVDPNHFNSNFNLGVTIFNKSNELIKERNALGYKQTKKYDELTLRINKQLETALPIWEKLYSLKKDDRTVLETLSYIYTNLGKMDKANMIEDELDKLGN